jgi:hypothetical protein
MQSRFGAAARAARGDWNVQVAEMRSHWQELRGVVTKPLFDAFNGALPVVNRVLSAGVAGARSGGIGGMVSGLGGAALGEERWKAIGTFFSGLWRSIRNGLGLTGKDFRRVFRAMQNVAKAVFAVLRVAFTMWLAVARKAIGGVQRYVRGMLRVVGGVVKLISGILTGDFRAAWEGMKQIARGAVQAVIGIFQWVTAPARAAIEGIWKGLGAAASAAFGAVKSVVVGALNWVIDQVNKVIRGINSMSFSTPFGDVGVHINEIANIGEHGQSKVPESGLLKFPKSGVIQQDGSVTQRRSPGRPRAGAARAGGRSRPLTVSLTLEGYALGKAQTRIDENREAFA